METDVEPRAAVSCLDLVFRISASQDVMPSQWTREPFSAYCYTSNFASSFITIYRLFQFRIKIGITFIFRLHRRSIVLVLFIPLGLSSFLNLWQVLLGVEVSSVPQPCHLIAGVQIINWGEKYVHWVVLSCNDIIEQVFGGHNIFQLRIKIGITFIFRLHRHSIVLVVFVPVGLSSFLHLWQVVLGVEFFSVDWPEDLTVGVEITDSKEHN